MIDVKELTYVFPDKTVGIHPSNLQLPSRSRTLLIGANGAGKSTLLRVLSGKTLAKQGAVRIYNKDPFRDNDLSITYLGTEWAANPIVRYDISVILLLKSMGGDAFPERRDELIDILDIDLRWHMHQVSDGERRRVQLAMGLLRPWTTLLLDEVTVDLDVLVRARLLDFLKRETETRDCIIMYATHIFDGISEWPTHVAHMHMGKILYCGDIAVDQDIETGDIYAAGEKLEAYSGGRTQNRIVKRRKLADGNEETIIIPRNGILMELAVQWLKRDLEERGERTDRIKWDDIKDTVH